MFQNLSSAPRQKLYLAAPLFSQAELAFNELLCRELEHYFDVYLPQRDGGQLVEMTKAGVELDDAARVVFEADMQALVNCNLLLIVLDGRAVDEGAAFELGVAHALGRERVGLRTDTRGPIHGAENAMIRRSLNHIFYSAQDLLAWAEERTAFRLGHATFPRMKPHSESSR